MAQSTRLICENANASIARSPRILSLNGDDRGTRYFPGKLKAGLPYTGSVGSRATSLHERALGHVRLA
jgi:hypothetical protein